MLVSRSGIKRGDIARRIQGYRPAVLLLTPIETDAIGKSGAPRTISMRMMVVGDLTPVLWREETAWRFACVVRTWEK